MSNGNPSRRVPVAHEAKKAGPVKTSVNPQKLSMDLNDVFVYNNKRSIINDRKQTVNSKRLKCISGYQIRYRIQTDVFR